jgi:oligopeptide/dipeptide ABC transporter ATP-binding protein
MACKPKLIIADEPTTALDTTIQREIIQLLLQLMNDFGMSLLLITHNLALVAEVCDRVYIMYAGKIVESADVYTIFENPIHPYSELLLKCVPRPDKTTAITYISGKVPDLLTPPSGCRFHPRCPYVIEKCREEEPTLKGGSNHLFACWVR